MSVPTLVAFRTEAQSSRYNVWRYDPPSTVNVLFHYKSESEGEAIEAARALLEKAND